MNINTVTEGFKAVITQDKAIDKQYGQIGEKAYKLMESLKTESGKKALESAGFNSIRDYLLKTFGKDGANRIYVAINYYKTVNDLKKKGNPSQQTALSLVIKYLKAHLSDLSIDDLEQISELLEQDINDKAKAKRGKGKSKGEQTKKAA